MVWWLGFGVFTAVAWVQSLVGELGSCKLCMQWKHGVLSFTLFMVSFEEKKDLKKCLFFSLFVFYVFSSKSQLHLGLKNSILYFLLKDFLISLLQYN